MYREHSPILRQWAQARPHNLGRVAGFAIASAHVPFRTVVDLYPALFTPDESPDIVARIAYGPRYGAIAWAREHSEEIFFNCMDLFEHSGPDELLRYAATLPGLGLDKAGFFLQMAFGRSGCLDVHNRRRLGLPAPKRAEREKDASPKTRLRHAARYNAAIRKAGGTGRLWDTWCRHMAREYPAQFESGAHVSRLHLEVFGLA